MGPWQTEPPSHLQKFLSLGIRQLEICEDLMMAVPEGTSQGEAMSVTISFVHYGIRELAPAFNSAPSFQQMRHLNLSDVLPIIQLEIVSWKQNPIFQDSLPSVNTQFKVITM